jgi:hypothetical protein
MSRNTSQEEPPTDEEPLIQSFALQMMSEPGGEAIAHATAWAEDSAATLDAANIERCRDEARTRVSRFNADRDAALRRLFSRS